MGFPKVFQSFFMDICSLFINFSPVFMPEKFESNIFLFVKPFNSGQSNVKKGP